MLKPYQIQANSVLLISDPHQDLNFIHKVLEKEKGNYDFLILNGDFFDSNKDEVNGAKEVANFILNVQNCKYGPAWLNLGNHDLPYAESWSQNQKYRNKRPLINSCGGFSKNKAIKINRILKWENWLKFNLFCEFSGYVISHAGIHPNYWDFYSSVDDNLDKLWIKSREAIKNISHSSNELFEVGKCRGGDKKVGGICWLDFVEEFQPHKDMPLQIVGHTNSSNCIQTKNGNICIDGAQSTYAVLKSDGQIRFGYIYDRFEKEEVFFNSVIW